jgi:hypothetical protein
MARDPLESPRFADRTLSLTSPCIAISDGTMNKTSTRAKAQTRPV